MGKQYFVTAVGFKLNSSVPPTVWVSRLTVFIRLHQQEFCQKDRVSPSEQKIVFVEILQKVLDGSQNVCSLLLCSMANIVHNWLHHIQTPIGSLHRYNEDEEPSFLLVQFLLFQTQCSPYLGMIARMRIDIHGHPVKSEQGRCQIAVGSLWIHQPQNIL